MITRADMSRDITNEELYDIIDLILMENSKNEYISVKQRIELRNDIFNSIRGLDILEKIINNDEVTEIMINGPDNIFIEKRGKLQLFPGRFTSKERLMDVIQQIVSTVNRRVNESSPIVDTRLKDGSRVNIVLEPIALNGPVVTIRKFPLEVINMEKLIEYGSIDRETSEWLKTLVISGYNIFISGGTGSGKTTFLNALSNFIPQSERIITIEDSAELQIKGISNLVRMEVRQENTEGENGVSIRDLIRASLRMRPDRIIVGEVRGAEALDMIQAMNTGHDGSLSTGHANSSEDMLKRLEIMILMAVEMPLSSIRGQLAAGIDIIIHLGRLRDKSRKVLEIKEVIGMRDGEIETSTLYKFIEDNERDGIIEGHLEKCKKELQNNSKLKAAGLYSTEDD